MANSSSKKLVLEDGSKIGVVGGGPSGSFFAYFALDFAKRFDLDISVDIIEAKDFNSIGPAGCNNCGGLVSESLIQMLATEGIVLPSNVIRRGIESYTLHLEPGSTVIEAPHKEQRIAAMFRGMGPKGSVNIEQHSFDNYLLELSEHYGANIIRDRVSEIERTNDGIIIKTKNNFEKKYDLVVGAVGLNQKTFELFHQIIPKFVTPKTTKTHICEFYLGKDLVDDYFGHSMHVFLLNLPKIKFGALIPKGHFVTLVLLGSDINKEVVDRFLSADSVKNCFPPDLNLEKIDFCHCYPYINVKGAQLEFDDRVVLVGDSSSSKLYKNGIGAAYITAKAAANTAIFYGIANGDFKKHFQPVCKNLNMDNGIGKLIFSVTGLIQKSSILKGAMLKLVIREQEKERKKRLLSAMLWDTFTGSAPYKGILMNTFHPTLILALVWYSIKETFGKFKIKKT